MLAVPAVVALGAIRSLVTSRLVTVICSPPAGAAAPSEPESAVSRSLPIVPSPTLIDGGGFTEIDAVFSVMPGALARSVVVLTATPVTGTCTDVVPAATCADDGTVATLELSIDVLIVNPPGG